MNHARSFKLPPFCLYLAVLAFAFTVLRSAIADNTAEPIILDEENPSRVTFGQLTWRGGLSIHASDKRFGGLSALHVDTEGREMIALTDQGTWVKATLSYQDGNLTSARRFRYFPVRDPSGKAVSGRRSDAESIVKTDNGFVVSFERYHRLLRYATEPGAEEPDRTGTNPSSIPVPRGLKKLPDNGGIEAMTQLCDGRLFIVAEKSIARRNGVAAWVQSKRGWEPLSYQTQDGLRPTGAATLPNCDIVFVERSFSFLAGLDIRITRVSAAAIRPGATLLPTELAHLSAPLTIDNFEGISARRDAAGNTVIYLVSDDNFSAVQRTLLIMFGLNE